jgi:hypothetical protein
MMPLSQDAKDINAVRSTRAGCRPRGDKNERDKKLFVAPSNLDLPDYAGHPSTHQEYYSFCAQISHPTTINILLVFHEIQLTK